MKKLLFVALLMIALVFTVVACQGNKNPDDTTAGDTTVASDVTKAPEESTKAPDDATKAPEETTEVPDETTQAPAVTTEEPPVTTEDPPVETEEPETTEALPETDDPAEPVHVIDPEAIHSNATSSGGLTFVQEVGSAEIITEGGRTFVRLTVDQNGGGDPYVTVINIGSNLTLPNYMAISYRTNSTMDGQFFMGSGVGWSGQGDSFNASWNEDDAWNLLIVDLSATGMTSITDGLINYARMDFFAGKGAEGDHFDVEYIAFFNSAEYAHAYDFEMHKAPMWDEEKNVVTHLSFDELYKGSDSKNNFFTPGQSGSWDKVATLNDFSVSYLTYWGWVGVKGEIGQFGYQINGGSAIFDDAWTYSNPAENLLPHCPAGTDNATRMKIAISLDGLEGTNSVRTLYKSADGSVVCLTEFTVVLPEAPKDITDTFTSDISSQDVGTALGSTDLKNFFTMNLPLPGSGVEAFGDGKIYNMTSINEMYAQMDGLYYIKTNNVESNSSGWMFVRGYAVVNADSLIEAHNPDAGIYKINNFYETDGNGYMGGAGIYARIENGVLHIMVKYYDSEKLSRVNNKFYSIACTGTELAMADNGSVVSILVDGKTMATIAISGSITYDDMKEGNVLPYNTFASTVVVKLADGTVETIENTLVADTYDCQVGVVARSGVFKFESIEVGKLSDIHIPDMKPDEPADVRTDKTEYVVGEDILVTANGSAYDWVGLYLEDDIADATAEGGVGSIYWYYVAAGDYVPGTAVNIRNTESNRSDYADIPAGQYKLILFKDNGYEVLAEIHFTVKAAETEEPSDENAIKVTTTDNDAWVDEYTFTAEAAGTYTFTLPAGLGMYSLKAWDAWGDAELDYNMNPNGGDVKVTLKAGEEYKFYVGATTKADWVITYTFTAGEVGGGDEGGEGGDEPAAPTELAIGVNTIPVTAADLDAGAIAYTFTVTDAGMYTFASNDLMAQIYDADGNMIARGMSYLKPGVYTIQVVVAYVSAPGNYSITVEYEAVDENGYKTETAYKFYTVQGKLESTPTLYLDGGVSTRYLTTTTDITKAIDVYLEAAEGGYKIYTLVDGAKQYVEVYLNDSSKVSVRYNADANCVFAYNAETYAWETTLEGVDYYLGTFNTYETISASKTSFINAENTRVSQFPLELVLSE